MGGGSVAALTLLVSSGGVCYLRARVGAHGPQAGTGGVLGLLRRASNSRVPLALLVLQILAPL